MCPFIVDRYFHYNFEFIKKINDEAIKSRDKTRLVLQKKETNAANIAKFRMKQVEQIR